MTDKNTEKGKQKIVTLYLDDDAPAQVQSLNRDDQRTVLTPTSLQISGACNSDKELNMFIAGLLKRTYKNRVDLIVIPNAAALVTRGILAEDAWSSANMAHKRLREWCDKNGCALVMALPEDRDDFDSYRLAPHVDAVRFKKELVEEVTS